MTSPSSSSPNGTTSTSDRRDGSAAYVAGSIRPTAASDPSQRSRWRSLAHTKASPSCERELLHRPQLCVARRGHVRALALSRQVGGPLDQRRDVEVVDEPGATTVQCTREREWEALRDHDVGGKAFRVLHLGSRSIGIRSRSDALLTRSDEGHVELLAQLRRKPVIADPRPGHLCSDRVRRPHDHTTHSRIVPFRVRAVVVIPTFNARDLLADALESIEAQTVPAEIVVVDNASTDGTVEMLEARFPQVTVVRNTSEPRLRTGRQPRRRERGRRPTRSCSSTTTPSARPTSSSDSLAPLADPPVGMVAGVLLQGSAPGLVDSAGIELDTTLRSWDMLWNRPVDELARAAEPVGPCGGAAAYRAVCVRRARRLRRAVLRVLGGRRPGAPPPAGRLGMRSRSRRPSAPPPRRNVGCGVTGPEEARGVRPRLRPRQVPRRTHRPRQATQDRPSRLAGARRPRASSGANSRRCARGRRAVATDWPSRPCEHPSSLRRVGFREAIGRQASLLRLRFSGGLPEHFGEHAPSVSARTAVDDEERATGRH